MTNSGGKLRSTLFVNYHRSFAIDTFEPGPECPKTLYVETGDNGSNVSAIILAVKRMILECFSWLPPCDMGKSRHLLERRDTRAHGAFNTFQGGYRKGEGLAPRTRRWCARQGIGPRPIHPRRHPYSSAIRSGSGPES